MQSLQTILCQKSVPKCQYKVAWVFSDLSTELLINYLREGPHFILLFLGRILRLCSYHSRYSISVVKFPLAEVGEERDHLGRRDCKGSFLQRLFQWQSITWSHRVHSTSPLVLANVHPPCWNILGLFFQK